MVRTERQIVLIKKIDSIIQTKKTNLLAIFLGHVFCHSASIIEVLGQQLLYLPPVG